MATSPQESDALNPAAMTATILNNVAALRGVAFLNPHYFLANNADEEIWQGALIVVRQRKPGFRLVQGGCVGRPGSTSLRSANFSSADLPIARLEVAIATRQHPLGTEPLAQYSSAARSKSNEVIHRCRRWRTPPKHEPFTTLDVPFRTPLAISQRPRLGQKTRSSRSP